MREETGVDLIYIIKKWNFEIPRTIYKRRGGGSGGGDGGEKTGKKLGGWRRERTSEKVVSEVGSREYSSRAKTSKVTLSVTFWALRSCKFSTPSV